MSYNPIIRLFSFWCAAALVVISCTKNFSIEASRLFSGPYNYPPTEYAAYGIVAFRSRANSFDSSRHRLICESYIANIPHALELGTPKSHQMVTIWPVDTDDLADLLNRRARKHVCDDAIERYNLVAARRSIEDAKKAGWDLDGRGPFLIAWSPAKRIGSPDVAVLTADLSHVDNLEQANRIFLTWLEDIEKDTDLWDPDSGWNLELLRLKIQHWADRFGPRVLSVSKG